MDRCLASARVASSDGKTVALGPTALSLRLCPYGFVPAVPGQTPVELQLVRVQRPFREPSQRACQHMQRVVMIHWQRSGLRLGKLNLPRLPAPLSAPFLQLLAQHRQKWCETRNTL
ncbi:hypothetical protein ACLKA7_000205 [Drosophila subpalustris]